MIGDILLSIIEASFCGILLIGFAFLIQWLALDNIEDD